MISVCYLSPSRRRRAPSRWCWALAPGGCWMWLGRERKTTKTTVWCTAKVSEQHRHPVISPQRNTPHHATPQHRHKDTDNSPSSPLSTACLSLPACLSPSSFSFFSPAPLVSQSHKRTPVSACAWLQGHTKRHMCSESRAVSVFLIQRVIYITKTLIRSWETSLDTQS